MAQPDVSPRGTSFLDHHPEPWTEEEYFALPEGLRAELLDGSLLVSPHNRCLHQVLAGRIFAVLDSACPAAFRVIPEFDVRTAPGRIFIPDVSVVTDVIGPRDTIANGPVVRLAVEVASPSTLLVDRVLKTRAYAEAGIPRLLRVEWDAEDRPTGLLYVLEGEGYRIEEFAGRPVVLDEPFPVTLDLESMAQT